VGFQREFTNDQGQKDVSKGIVYYWGDKLAVKVYYPIDQIMVLSGNTMTIYYPKEKTAFDIHARIPFELPFVSVIVAPNQPNYGLTQMGYRLEKSERSGDTLTSFWLPPTKAEKVVGRFKLVECKRKLLYAQSFKPNGKISTTVLFSNYRKTSKWTVALDVTAYSYTSTGMETEIIHFQTPEFDKAVPDSIANFRIPEGTPVKREQW
jgi:outer membrane lipoprotein-sorting protein